MQKPLPLGAEVDAILDALAPLVGICGVRCEHGGSCTLDKDHNGPHQSGDGQGGYYCEWS